MNRVSSVLMSLLVSVATVALLPSAPSGAVQDDSSTIKRVVRQYGDGPVLVRRNQLLVLSFKGRQGDRVRLNRVFGTGTHVSYASIRSSETKLFDVSRHRLSADPLGFFRLPRAGWFTFRFRTGDFPGASEKVQLFVQDRVRYHAGETTTLPNLRGHQYVVRVRVPKDRLDLVSFGTDHWGIWTPQRYTPGGVGPAILVGATFPVVDGATNRTRSRPLEAGESVLVLLEPGRPASVVSHPAAPVSLEVDGAAAPPAGAQSTVAATFSGTTDQIVQLDHDLEDSHRVVLFGPGHRIQRRAWGRGVYQLRHTGVFVAVPIPFDGSPAQTGLRLRSLVEAGSVQVDGPPLVVDAQPDGRLVMAHVVREDTAGLTYLAVTEDTLSSSEWWGSAGVFALYCPSRGPLGCGDYSYAEVRRELPVPLNGFYGDFALVDTDSSATGSVSIAFTSTYPGP